jgi:hypothetical protein
MNKLQLIDHLLWRYEGILKEVINQKANFQTDADYCQALIKYSHRVNYLQGAKFRTLLSN